ncbi:MAG: DNA mismatch repair protein [Actinobacteria bacterium ADurb.Bin346]|nr:MAG: DNA mismatch repair protein [Actinobacteria bacterium ADurb.Bin346]
MQKEFDFNKFFSDLKISGDFKIEEDLGNGFVKLKISEAERRQALQDIHCVEDIVVELLRNSRDAGSTKVYVATKKAADKRRVIYFIDNGYGIPPKFHNLIFQSRVTSKLEDGARDAYGFHGRGMALFSVRLNVEDIRITFSDVRRGTCVFTDIDLAKIPEKKDQSLVPKIIKSSSGYELSGGVNNILKIIMDFSVQNPHIKYYYGSLTGIASTLMQEHKNSERSGQAIDYNIADKITDLLKFKNKILNNPEIPITSFLYYCSNIEILDEVLKKYFNMNLSFRSLQRLFYGEITPLKDVLHIENGLIDEKEPGNESTPGLKKNHLELKKMHDLKLYDESGLAGRFKDEEIKYIIKQIEETVKKLGEKYFVTIQDSIEYKKSNNTINLIINLKQKE